MELLRFSRWLVVVAAAACLAALAAPAPAVSYTDVAKWHWAWDYIQGVSDADIAAGYPEGTYQPSTAVSRDQMAVFIARAMCGGEDFVPDPTCTDDPFPDVPCDFWARPHIVYCMDQGVVQGYDTGYYEPGFDVTRGQMAAFISRAMCGGDQYVPSGPAEPTFPDVTADGENSWCYDYVEYIAGEEVTLGYPDGLYHPEIACSRAQMAAYLCRAFDLATPPRPYHITEHFPLGGGDTWVYEAEDDVYSKTVSGTQELFGELYAQMIEDSGDVEYWRAAPEGLYLGGFYWTEEGLISFSPAFCIANGLDPGANDAQTATAYLDGVEMGAVQFTYEFIGVEDVTVPAGTFEDCMKLHITLDMGGDFTEFYLWAARDRGLVKTDARDFGSDDWDILISATVAGVRQPRGGPYRLEDYYPLEVGGTWVYSGSDGTEIEQIVGVDEVGGVDAARIDSGPTLSTPDRRYYTVLDGSLNFVGEYDADGPTLITFSPPISFPETVQVGDFGTEMAEVYADGSSVGTGTFRWAVVENGPLTVPAGTFGNCLKMRIRMTDPSDVSSEFYMWLSAGVGPVKQDERDFGGSYWREMESAHVCGIRYPTAGQTFAIDQYCDLSVGNSWTFDSGDTVSAVGEQGSAPTWTELDDGEAVHLVRATGFGLYYLGFDESGGSSVRLSPPLDVSGSLSPGDSDEQTVSTTVDGYSSGQTYFSYTFEGIEGTRTEAGFFNGCMKIEYTLATPVTPTETATTWWAPDVGVVRLESDSGSASLASAQVDARTYPTADAVFNVSDYYSLVLSDEWRMVRQGEWNGASERIVSGTLDVSGLGITDTVRKVEINEADEYWGSDLMAVTADGLKRYGFEEPDGTAMVAESGLLIPDGVQIGDSGSLTTDVYGGQPGAWAFLGEMDAEWAVLDAGPVTTSAGHFPDCLLIWWSADTPEETVSTYEWLARGVGPVKTYETNTPSWQELMGAVIVGSRIPQPMPPTTSTHVRHITEGTSVGFDFSAAGMTSNPDDMDLQFVSYDADNAVAQSTISDGISTYIGYGDYDYMSYWRFQTYIPPDMGIWGDMWYDAVDVRDDGTDKVGHVFVVKTRDGLYALVKVTNVTETTLSIEYAFPYSWFNWP